MDQTKEMLMKVEELIINQTNRLMAKPMGPSPEEMEALAELVQASNQIPRTIEVFPDAPTSEVACKTIANSIKKAIADL